MNDTANTHRIDDTHRIVLSYNTWATDLNDILGEPCENFGVFIFPTGRFDYTHEWATFSVREVFKQLENELFDYTECWGNDNLATFESAFSVKLAELGVTQSAYKTIRGYSQGDVWRVCVFGDTSEQLADMAALTGTWLRNDIYTASYQELETWTKANGATKQTWETVMDRAQVFSATGEMYPSLAECAEALDIPITE